MVFNDHDTLGFHSDISFLFSTTIIIAKALGQIWVILRYGD